MTDEPESQDRVIEFAEIAAFRAALERREERGRDILRGFLRGELEMLYLTTQQLLLWIRDARKDLVEEELREIRS